MRYRGKVKNLDEAIAKEPAVGDGFIVKDEEQMYIWSGTEWEVPKQNINLKMTNYEINQQVYAQLPEISHEKMEEGIDCINDFAKERDNVYYMMLCRDQNYYTLFHYSNGMHEFSNMANAVIALLQEIGTIKGIEFDNVSQAIEIWITSTKGTTNAYYLFPYDAGVVEITDMR